MEVSPPRLNSKRAGRISLSEEELIVCRVFIIESNGCKYMTYLSTDECVVP